MNCFDPLFKTLPKQLCLFSLIDNQTEPVSQGSTYRRRCRVGLDITTPPQQSQLGTCCGLWAKVQIKSPSPPLPFPPPLISHPSFCLWDTDHFLIAGSYFSPSLPPHSGPSARIVLDPICFVYGLFNTWGRSSFPELCNPLSSRFCL